jgi:ABC-type uncharacterized transport system permease subunit
MMTIICGLIAVLLYASSAWLQRQRLISPATTASTRGSNAVLGLAILALVAHFCNAITVINTARGYDFGFFKVASLFSWVMALIVVLSSLRKPVANLFLALFPLAILCILCSSFLPSNYNLNPELKGGVALHSMLGIVAFSLLTIAAVQALLVAWLSKELKQHHFSTALRHLPPLQTLEELLFETIQAGFLALLAVILSGFIFMDDMFAQHLVHKTALTIISWAVFGILLWGRYQRGWRGKTALRWILVGFVVLILAYFGSKFVLEIVLDRV